MRVALIIAALLLVAVSAAERHASVLEHPALAFVVTEDTAPLVGPGPEAGPAEVVHAASIEVAAVRPAVPVALEERAGAAEATPLPAEVAGLEVEVAGPVLRGAERAAG